ncbi:unnamed protein product [Didymodactylos carnosus]|uniref:G-protein coupled receptors family 1 profile domain-containing protein n=1 Tax=Didymodactylos carnosus TaxID=1234261 RepID=A0A815AW31_9BILA|nr:unnamed protein product [Didymodactylos carnosus]CAF4042146.1 unnamed protein product [Didymodactylos carnosus]
MKVISSCSFQRSHPPEPQDLRNETVLSQRSSGYQSHQQYRPKSCILKHNVSNAWDNYLLDVKFDFNYHTLRSIFSEIIPTILVTLFNIGIILRVIKASCQLRLDIPRTIKVAIEDSSLEENTSTTQNFEKCIAYNRPKTSGMNIVLILHSCLFFFSSLTHTIVHLFTNDAFLTHSVSVIILANCSLNFYFYCLGGKTFRNETLRLFNQYFQYCFSMEFLNIFRTKSQRAAAGRKTQMNLIQSRSLMAYKTRSK